LNLAERGRGKGKESKQIDALVRGRISGINTRYESRKCFI
jgi:hypothetical protein